MADMKSNTKAGEATRTLRAMQSRWGIINNTVAKFVSAHTKAERSAPSGTNLVDMERRAMEIFRVEYGAGKSFDLRECWQVLKSNPKWQKPAGIPRDQGMSSSMEDISSPPLQAGTPSGTTLSTPVSARPVGAKRAKADFQQAKVSDKAIKEMKEANRLAKKRARIFQDQVALGYMKIQDQDVPPEFREVFMKRRARVLRELNAEEEEDLPSPAAPVHSPPQDHDDILEEPDARHVAQPFSQVGDDDEILCYADQLPYDHMSFRSISSLLEEEIMDPRDLACPRTNDLQERDLTLGI